MPPELEGSSMEVVVLADQFVIEGHGNSCRSKVKSQIDTYYLTPVTLHIIRCAFDLTFDL